MLLAGLRPRLRMRVCEDTSLLSDHLGEARTKFVGGLNITSRSGKGRPPSALRLVGDLQGVEGVVRGHLTPFRPPGRSQNEVRWWSEYHLARRLRAAALCTPAGWPLLHRPGIR